MAEGKLSKLRVKRNTLIAQQQRVKDFVDTKLDKASLYELETRLQALDKYYNDFQSIQGAIEEAEDPSTDDKFRAPYEELYFVLRPALLLRLADIRKTAKEETGADDVANQSLSSSSPLRLPKINLPTFSGDYTQWTSYYETFSALVVRNPGLDNVTRFHYLRSSLKDGALRRIESIEVTDENYEVALKLLVDRYQRKNVIVREHVRHLFNITPIAQRASATALRDLIDSFNVHLRALTTLGRPVAHWDDIIIEIVVQKLDHLTLDKWNDECPVDRIPTVDELFKFLERRCSHLEERSSSRPKVGSQASNNQTNARTAVNKIVLTSSKQSTPKVCTYCKGNNHLIYRCRKFLVLAPKQRFEAIHERNLCNNCLKVGHTHQTCASEKCRECNSSHHTLLHYNTFYLNRNNEGDMSKNKTDSQHN